MDWSSVAILALLMGMEGVRSVPPGALVLRRMLVGPWRVLPQDPYGAGGWRGWRLVALWPPFAMPLILPRRDGPDHQDWMLAPPSVRQALHCTRRQRALLRVLGGAVVIATVLGVPWALMRFGAWGFVGALGTVFVLALGSSILATVCLRRLGAPWRDALRLSRPFLSPFSAPRAAETVLHYTIRELPPLVAAHTLLDSATFAHWVRPAAYDALHPPATMTTPGTRDSVEIVLGRDLLTAAVATPPPGVRPGEQYCPRCASVFREGVQDCTDCGAIALVRFAAR